MSLLTRLHKGVKMTLENAKRLLDLFKANMNDSSLSTQARLNAKHAYEDMKKNLAGKGFEEEEPKKSKK